MQMNFVVQNLINCRSTLSMTAPETDANEVSKNLSVLYNPFSTVTPVETCFHEGGIPLP